MNHHEVRVARQRYLAHPVLGPASATLATLAGAADANSDGWAYWPKPAARGPLADALIGSDRDYLQDPARADATTERLRAAYTPLRALQTRTGIALGIYTPEEWTAVGDAAEVRHEAA